MRLDVNSGVTGSCESELGISCGMQIGLLAIEILKQRIAQHSFAVSAQQANV